MAVRWLLRPYHAVDVIHLHLHHGIVRQQGHGHLVDIQPFNHFRVCLRHQVGRRGGNGSQRFVIVVPFHTLNGKGLVIIVDLARFAGKRTFVEPHSVPLELDGLEFRAVERIGEGELLLQLHLLLCGPPDLRDRPALFSGKADQFHNEMVDRPHPVGIRLIAMVLDHLRQRAEELGITGGVSGRLHVIGESLFGRCHIPFGIGNHLIRCGLHAPVHRRDHRLREEIPHCLRHAVMLGGQVCNNVLMI